MFDAIQREPRSKCSICNNTKKKRSKNSKTSWNKQYTNISRQSPTIYTYIFIYYIYTYISIYIYMYIPFTLHVWTRASQGTSPQLHVRPMLWNDFGIVWGGAVTMIQQLQDWMDSGNATTRGWEYDWLKQIKTLHWYWWTDGCQILHQLVDDVSHDHPMIYSGL